MTLMRKAVLLLLMSLSSGVSGWGQDVCELTLNRATEEFNAGHFYVIPGLLKECLDQNQNQAWRQRAYLLLAETYLLLEDPIGAEDSYLKLLKSNPEFVTREDLDPIDLVYLSKRFTATPIFSLRGHLGPNVSPIRIINDVTIGGESYSRQRYSFRLGWQAGAGLDYNYSERLSLSLEIDYVFTTFNYRNSNLFGRDKDAVEFTDRQNWFTAPVLVRYSGLKGRMRPYGVLGYCGHLLLSDRGNITVINRDRKMGEAAVNTESVESPTLKFTHKRESFNQSVVLGGGFTLKQKLNYLFVEVRYSMGLTNVVNGANRYDDQTTRWPYVDDDFRMDNLAISVGYIHPFYKPRKLKKARTKSVLRNIKEGAHADH